MSHLSIWKRSLVAALVLAVSTTVLFYLEAWLLPTAGVALLLLLTVVVVAFITNFIGALITTVLAILAFNFLFSEPRYTLHMTDADEMVTALVFFLVAVAISHLTTSFRVQRERLRQSQLRSNILLSVSHDLRTPLATIMGNLSTLQLYHGKLLPDDREDLIQGAIDESGRLHRYIENLLQATRLQHGVTNVQLFEFDIQALLGRVKQRFVAPKKLVIHSDDDELLVAMQTTLLEQAFFNIIDNAYQYAGTSQPVEITISKQGTNAVVDIIDSGPGVNKSERAQIFDVFYSSRQRDSGTGGTGLGLPVSKGIIELHKGSIELVDASSGCHIRVILPLSSESEGGHGDAAAV
ncbi:phospho-acceptor domain-containing protein [Idiomarina aquatica]|uniref:histidine kinase n=1 Tax=Idiomarina aquatica TaxID=1327752 RepID=A0A4R6PQX5_9GAMM|nr:ATP-binding protein [Idiomarina aquatica]TDP40517.1 phospho-acceptor domain-containing protein [Idiomarina aquatica]